MESDVETTAKEMLERLKKLCITVNTLQGHLLKDDTFQCTPETFHNLERAYTYFCDQMFYLSELGCDLWGSYVRYAPENKMQDRESG